MAIAIAIYLLAHRVRRFWDRVKQGVAILTTPRRYLREVAAWQGVGWLFRFAAFWFFLEAFGIGGSVGNVMLVMSVQAIANIVPFTPGGAGAQQALLVATLHGPSRSAVLSFSVGTQIAMAAWSVVLGFAAMLLVFRTTDWRGLIKQAEEDSAEAGATQTRPPAQSKDLDETDVEDCAVWRRRMSSKAGGMSRFRQLSRLSCKRFNDFWTRSAVTARRSIRDSVS